MQNLINKSCIGIKIRKEPTFFDVMGMWNASAGGEWQDASVADRSAYTVNVSLTVLLKNLKLSLKMDSLVNVGASTSKGKTYK